MALIGFPNQIQVILGSAFDGRPQMGGLNSGDTLVLTKVSGQNKWTEDGTDTPNAVTNRIKFEPSQVGTSGIVKVSGFKTASNWGATGGNGFAIAFPFAKLPVGTDYNFKEVWSGLTSTVFFRRAAGGSTVSTSSGFIYNTNIFSAMSEYVVPVTTTAYGVGTNLLTSLANVSDKAIPLRDSTSIYRNSLVSQDSSGHVGIGTTVPSAYLDVERAGTIRTTTDFIELTNTIYDGTSHKTADGTTGVGILLNGAKTSGVIANYGAISAVANASMNNASNCSTKLTFSTLHQNIFAEKLSIDEHGIQHLSNALTAGSAMWDASVLAAYPLWGPNETIQIAPFGTYISVATTAPSVFEMISYFIDKSELSDNTCSGSFYLNPHRWDYTNGEIALRDDESIFVLNNDGNKRIEVYGDGQTAFWHPETMDTTSWLSISQNGVYGGAAFTSMVTSGSANVMSFNAVGMDCFGPTSFNFKSYKINNATGDYSSTAAGASLFEIQNLYDTRFRVYGDGDTDIAGELRIKLYDQSSEPTLSGTNFCAFWKDASNNLYLLFQRGPGDNVKVQLT